LARTMIMNRMGSLLVARPRALAAAGSVLARRMTGSRIDRRTLESG